MDRNASVLIVTEGGEPWPSLLGILAERFEYRVLSVRTPSEALALIEHAHVDLVLVEESDASFSGCELLARLRTSHPDVLRTVVLAGASEAERDAVARASVYQFLRQPIDAEQASLVLKRGLEARELARRHRLLAHELEIHHSTCILDHSGPSRPQSQRFEKLVYVSEKMTEVCDLARTAARTDLPIVIHGETGTGKELLARAIHFNSARRAGPLLVQSCGGMPEALLHSELFGHERGAYSGATSGRPGLFRAADGGTVFLDEISEMSRSFQVSLLRFIQEGVIKPLGSDRTLSSNVRVIAASNRSLAALVEAGELRRDLYYRLKGFELVLPPLRERPDDIPALAEVFMAKHSEATGRKILGISACVIEKLSAHAWLGNIRELEAEIRRMVVLTADGEYITTRHLSPEIQSTAPRQPTALAPRLGAASSTLKKRVETLERHAVREALARHRWNQSKAAAELGLSRVGLANKIKRYGLDRTDS